MSLYHDCVNAFLRLEGKWNQFAGAKKSSILLYEFIRQRKNVTKQKKHTDSPSCSWAFIRECSTSKRSDNDWRSAKNEDLDGVLRIHGNSVNYLVIKYLDPNFLSSRIGVVSKTLVGISNLYSPLSD